ncbi:MAG: FHA domain-containing protein, partial [Deltaproteobacteria bacterium]
MKKLQDFMKVVNTLSAEEFAEQFPHPVLFYSERPGAIEDFARTRMVESSGGGRIDRFSRQVLDLVVLLPNPHTNREFPRKILIGRDKQRDFVVSHNTVSARHATLLL